MREPVHWSVCSVLLLSPLAVFNHFLKNIFLILSHPPLLLVFPLWDMSICLIVSQIFLRVFLHFFLCSSDYIISITHLQVCCQLISTVKLLREFLIFIIIIFNSRTSILFFVIFIDVIYLIRYCHHTILSFLKIQFSLGHIYNSFFFF